MNTKSWALLMTEARNKAAQNGERTKVIGIQASKRFRRMYGSRWTYVVSCGPSCEICNERQV